MVSMACVECGDSVSNELKQEAWPRLSRNPLPSPTTPIPEEVLGWWTVSLGEWIAASSRTSL